MRALEILSGSGGGIDACLVLGLQLVMLDRDMLVDTCLDILPWDHHTYNHNDFDVLLASPRTEHSIVETTGVHIFEKKRIRVASDHWLKQFILSTVLNRTEPANRTST